MQNSTEVIEGEPAGALTRRGFIGRTTTAAALAGTLGAGAVATAPAVAKPAKVRARRSSHDSGPLPDVKTLKGSKRDLVDHEVVELAAMLHAGWVSSVEITQAYLDAHQRAQRPVRDLRRQRPLQRVRPDRRGGRARRGARGRQAPVGPAAAATRRRGCAASRWASRTRSGPRASSSRTARPRSPATSRCATPRRSRGCAPRASWRSASRCARPTPARSPARSPATPGTSTTSRAAPARARASRRSRGSPPPRSARRRAARSSSRPRATARPAIKPSLGLGSTAGVMPLSPSYDVIGPIARSGRDAALIMNAILGPDPDGDPQTMFAPVPFPEIPMAPRRLEAAARAHDRHPQEGLGDDAAPARSATSTRSRSTRPRTSRRSRASSASCRRSARR